jgi:nucleosome assembly protein 1-like 1
MTVSADEKEELMEVDGGGDLSNQIASTSLADDDDDEDDEEEEDDDNDDDDDDDDDAMQDLPPCVAARVEQLIDLNAERDLLMMTYVQERAALEKKYYELCKPLYEKRSSIVNGTDGTSEPTGEATENDDPVGIPQFWVCAMGHDEDIAELLTEEDVDCLEYLTDITCDDFEDGKGFELKFHFSETNPYFTNKVLTKTYHVPNLLVSDEPRLQQVMGCDIDWKDGKCLTFKTIKKKQRGKGKHSGQIRTISKQEHKDSFFHFFMPPKMPSMEEMDEDEADRLEEAFDADYDVAQAFRLHVIPKAILWFTGQGEDLEDLPGTLQDEEYDDELAAAEPDME